MNKTHNRTKTATYRCWSDMKRRCNKPTCPYFKDYGGRGIAVCPEWENSFGQFLFDMGEKPPGMSLDRIDNSAGYGKENCRWATPAEQRRNQRDCVYMEHQGERLTLADWASRAGLNPWTFRKRYALGHRGDSLFAKPDPKKSAAGRKGNQSKHAAIDGSGETDHAS